MKIPSTEIFTLLAGQSKIQKKVATFFKSGPFRRINWENFKFRLILTHKCHHLSDRKTAVVLALAWKIPFESVFPENFLRFGILLP